MNECTPHNNVVEMNSSSYVYVAKEALSIGGNSALKQIKS